MVKCQWQARVVSWRAGIEISHRKLALGALAGNSLHNAQLPPEFCGSILALPPGTSFSHSVREPV